MKKIILIILLLIQITLYANTKETSLSYAFVLCVQNNADVNSAWLLIKSIRELGGKFSKSTIYVVSNENGKPETEKLKSLNVKFLKLELPQEAENYPFAHKPYACAQVEKLVSKENTQLIWLDNDCLVLSEPEQLELIKGKLVAVRPVFLQNRVAQEINAPIDAFWKQIYKQTNVDSSKITAVETFIDSKKIRFYINCQVITVDPKAGIFTQWEKDFSILLKDKQFQTSKCTSRFQKIFLHQTVLSSVIISKTKPEQIQWFGNEYGFPLLHFERIPESKKIDINQSKILIYESYFIDRPNWMNDLKLNETLKKWITQNYIETLKVSDRIFRYEGLSNSYLINTNYGNVLVDPCGASSPDNWLMKANTGKQLKAILITHGHEDHLSGISIWKKDLNIPVIANEKIKEFVQYQDMFAPYFAKSTAKHRGYQVPKEILQNSKTKLDVNTFFKENYTLKTGDLTFEMTHTGGETPDVSLIWIPELKALFIADNYSGTFPNIYTLKGTTPRWVTDYIKSLDLAIKYQPEILLNGHDEPIIGKNNILKKLSDFRDAIQYVFEQTVKGINEGKDVFTLLKDIKLPETYKDDISEGYGRVSWTVRGIYESYIGWFNGNVSNMYSEPAFSVYQDLIEIAGKDQIINKCKELFQKGLLSKALHMTDVILIPEPNDKKALEIRLEIINALRKQCFNWIELNWLNYEAGRIKEILNNK